MTNTQMMLDAEDAIATLNGPAAQVYVEADKKYEDARKSRDALVEVLDNAAPALARIARTVLRRECRKADPRCSVEAAVDARSIYDHSKYPPERKAYLTMSVFVHGKADDPFGIRLEQTLCPVAFPCIVKASRRMAAAVAGIREYLLT